MVSGSRAVYRLHVTGAMPAGFTCDAADAARDTLGAAVAVVPRLPPDAGAALLELERAAFTRAFEATAAINGALSIATAILAAVLLRRVRAGLEPLTPSIKSAGIIGSVTNKDAVGQLIEYTKWANHRVVRAAATLGVSDYKRDLGASHGGVRGTLAHMLGTERLWLHRWNGFSPPPLPHPGQVPDLPELRSRWK